MAAFVPRGVVRPSSQARAVVSLTPQASATWCRDSLDSWRSLCDSAGSGRPWDGCLVPPVSSSRPNSPSTCLAPWGADTCLAMRLPWSGGFAWQRSLPQSHVSYEKRRSVSLQRCRGLTCCDMTGGTYRCSVGRGMRTAGVALRPLLRRHDFTLAQVGRPATQSSFWRSRGARPLCMRSLVRARWA